MPQYTYTANLVANSGNTAYGLRILWPSTFSSYCQDQINMTCQRRQTKAGCIRSDGCIVNLCLYASLSWSESNYTRITTKTGLPWSNLLYISYQWSMWTLACRIRVPELRHGPSQQCFEPWVFSLAYPDDHKIAQAWRALGVVIVRRQIKSNQIIVYVPWSQGGLLGLYWGFIPVGVWVVVVWVFWFLVVGVFLVVVGFGVGCLVVGLVGWWLFVVYGCFPWWFFCVGGGGLLIVFRITSISAAVFLSFSGSSVKMSSVGTWCLVCLVFSHFARTCSCVSSSFPHNLHWRSWYLFL